jgi:hypothetical protein
VYQKKVQTQLKGNKACTKTTDTYFFLTVFQSFELLVHDHCLITLNVNCTRVKKVFSIQTTITNLVFYTDFLSPLDCSHSQVDTIYFDLCSDFDHVPHTFLLHKLVPTGCLMVISVVCPVAYLDVILLLESMAFVLRPSKCFLIFCKDLLLGPCC